MSINIKAFNDDINGRKQFTEHLLNTTLERTNNELASENLDTFSFYRKHEEEYPDEFLIAKQAFTNQLWKLMEEVANDILKVMED